MKIRRLATCLFLLFGLRGLAQDRYAVDFIPPELKTRAGAVIRTLDLHVDIKAMDNVIYHYKKAVTLLNASAEQQASLSLGYDKTLEIKFIRGVIFNEAGKPESKFTEHDFTDNSAVHDFSLFEDTRIRTFIPQPAAYPYTVEYEYELHSRQSLSLPDWECNPVPGLAVENASLTVTAPTGNPIRYKENNYQGTAVKTEGKDGTTTWSWAVKTLKARKDEPLSPDPLYTVTAVQLAPGKFQYRGISGSFSNWKEYGQWVSDQLLAGRSAIPAATALELKAMTDGVTDPKAIARKIYAFVQQKMRYVSVQIGAGGFQPATATETDRLSYGDCKALVNYTRSLLALAGINSYYTLVAAGSRKESLQRDFATMNFGNHVILCLPFKNDTTWLECTSKTTPFGYLGDFTDDRDVMACTENGGQIMHTPAYTDDENLTHRTSVLQLETNGRMNGSATTLFSGTEYDAREALAGLSKTEQIKKVTSFYDLNDLEVSDYELVMDKGNDPVTTEKMAFNYGGGTSSAGDNLVLIEPGQLNEYREIPREVSNRVNPLYIGRGSTVIDEVSISLPTGYTVENLPENISVEKPFGQFSTSCSYKDGKVSYVRKLQVKQGTFPPAAYAELVDFYQLMRDADHRKVVLKRP